VLYTETPEVKEEGFNGFVLRGRYVSVYMQS
jgi:hypothetical protein